MLRTVTKVWKPPLRKKTLISVNKGLFQKFVKAMLGFVRDCYVLNVLEDRLVSLLGSYTPSYENHERRSKQWSMGIKESRMCNEIYRMISYFELKYRQKEDRYSVLSSNRCYVCYKLLYFQCHRSHSLKRSVRKIALHQSQSCEGY